MKKAGVLADTGLIRIPVRRSVGGRVRCGHAGAAAARAGRFVVSVAGGSGRDAERRGQTVGVDPVAFRAGAVRHAVRGRGAFRCRDRSGLDRGVTPGTPAATRGDQRRIGLQHGFGARFEVLAGGRGIGAALAGDLGFRLDLLRRIAIPTARLALLPLAIGAGVLTRILTAGLALGARGLFAMIVGLVVPAARLTVAVLAIVLLAILLLAILVLPVLLLAILLGATLLLATFLLAAFLLTAFLLTAITAQRTLGALATGLGVAVAPRLGTALLVTALLVPVTHVTVADIALVAAVVAPVVAVAVAAVAAVAIVAAPVIAVAATVLLLAGADRLTLVAIIVVIAVNVEIGLLAARLLILEAATLVAENAEIMVGELQIIFGVHAVALPLRIRGEVLVLLVQLVGVAARAVVDAVAVVGTTLATGTRATAVIATTAGIATTTATATGLPIIDQAVRP